MADYDNDNLDEEVEESEDYWRATLGKDAMVFMIDASPSMYEQAAGDERALVEICLKCVDSSVRDRIIASGNDFMGLVFFATEGQNQEEFKHITVYRELLQPSSDFVKQIGEDLEEGLTSLKGTAASAENFKLSEALWICSDMFKNCKSKLASKRIILFTNNDNPHAGKPDLQRQARQKAQDLKDNGVEIELLPLGNSFDVKAFYEPIVQSYEENPADKLKELQKRVRRRNYKRRPNAHVGLELAPGVKLGVEVYNLVRPLHKPTAMKKYGASNVGVSTETSAFLPATGDRLHLEDVVKTQTYGGKTFGFSQAEARDLKSIIKDPIIRVVGFKDKDLIPVHHHVGPASFIYPDEISVKGSAKLFKALLDRCVEKKVYPIAWFMPRRNVNIRLTALVPQEEVKDEDGDQLVPPGFHVVPMPYAEDFRHVEIAQLDENGEVISAPDEAITVARKVVEKLKRPYADTVCENPTLQVFWRALEELSTEKKGLLEDFVDTTLPDNDAIEANAGEFLEKLRNLVYPSEYDPNKAVKKPSTSRRRLTSPTPKADGDTGHHKRTKHDLSEIGDMMEYVKDGKVEKLTVDVLKQYLHGEGIKTSGLKKADLVAQVYSHLGAGSY